MKECFKCREKASFNYKNGLHVCRQCFQSHVMLRRIRSFLRNELGTFGRENTFYVCFDGSIESAVLAHLLFLSRAENSALKKKIFFEFSLVVPCSPWRKTEDAEVLNKAKLLSSELKVPVVVLETAGDEEASQWLALSERVPQKGGFRDDFFEILISNSLLRFAKGKKILFADFAERAAANALALFCTCRQNFVLQKCSPVWKANATVLARPLLECGGRDISYYAYINRLFEYAVVEKTTPEIFQNLPGQGSIHRLIMNFVSELHCTNQATAPAVLKVVEKLDSGREGLAINYVPQLHVEKVIKALLGEIEQSSKLDDQICLFCYASMSSVDHFFCKGCKVMFGICRGIDQNYSLE